MTQPSLKRKPRAPYEEPRLIDALARDTAAASIGALIASLRARKPVPSRPPDWGAGSAAVSRAFPEARARTRFIARAVLEGFRLGRAASRAGALINTGEGIVDGQIISKKSAVSLMRKAPRWPLQKRLENFARAGLRRVRYA
jgi:hypothetical protein